MTVFRHERARRDRLVRLLVGLALAVGLSSLAWAQGAPPPGAPQGPPPGGPPGAPGGRGAPLQTPRQMAPVDLTGTWVSVITEDWRFRMMTPRKGLDIDGVPMTGAARQAADAWDSAADEAAGLACKGYGAPALMRLPGRARISWESDTTLKLEYDTGQQTRSLQFGGRPPAAAQPSWQGYSVAEWERETVMPRGGGPGAGPAPGGGGPPGAGPGRGRGFGPALTRSLKVVTTQLRPGYLRKNGIPYSANAALTEYFDLRTEQNGDVWFTVVSIVEDPENLTGPYIISSDFKKEPDGSKWMPTPCSAK